MINICKENNEAKEFYDHIYLLEITLRKISSIIQEKIDAKKLLLFNIRNLKHILFLMKDISFPKELYTFKSRIINDINIFESVCFGIEETYMKRKKFSEKQFNQLLELYFEISRFLVELNEKAQLK
ncbi:hypothetical protein [Clostridium massiliamazoniense]|uniref:hypothetical protein n=1 Tax=Clostridium massiliamazoniense TaxID=1347366 RepID=UPI0006D790A1|nr:hypothetical protein [Clostridium massiliamazoniense]